jgi:hypothetical protein
MNEKPNVVLGGKRPGIDDTKKLKTEEYEKWPKLLYSGLTDINVGCGACSISKPKFLLRKNITL